MKNFFQPLANIKKLICCSSIPLASNPVRLRFDKTYLEHVNSENMGYLTCASALREPPASDSIDLVHEDYTRLRLNTVFFATTS